MAGTLRKRIYENNRDKSCYLNSNGGRGIPQEKGEKSSVFVTEAGQEW
jgi:hypothetical protein